MNLIGVFSVSLLALFEVHVSLAGEPGLDSLVAEALRHNPELKAARQGADASRSRVNQVDSWESPQVGMEFFQTPASSFPDPARHSMENDYYIQQTIPFPGKISATRRSAESEAGMTGRQKEAIENSIVRDVKSAYYELYLVQKKIQVNDENRELMKTFVEIARKQYEVGGGKQADVLRAQTELSTLANDGINLEEERKLAESMLNTLLSRPADAALDSATVTVRRIPSWPFDRIQPLALQHRPELQSMSSAIDMRTADVSAARNDFWPDIMTRVMYKDMVGSRTDFWSAMIGVSIPLAPWSGGRYTSKVEEGELNLEKSREEYEAMKNTISYEVRRALVKVQTNRNLVDLYGNTVIPQAQQTLQSTTADYQSGKAEFLDLIDAYRVVLNARLAYFGAVAEYMTSQARLEQAVGLPIDQIASQLH